ncbi:hypothetical protein DPMN_063111 [Dreissena polymorpha]|uniref:TIR domain-containing protein n=1 Tax=Dreissena polymorpha TaxID=45954 RepID=A0A9D4HIB4_DREPO|nr:hypothetical protein DPMN_063111 [Dreissena polymorpha]
MFLLNTASPNIQYKYDAFVCYNQADPEDQRFVTQLIEELEGRSGLRLYVPGRNDVLTEELEGRRGIRMVVPGRGVLSIANQIAGRCRMMIIVMSRSFLQSPINDFQEQYAQGVGRERLIPIIREEGVIVPRIHEGGNIYDLTNTDNEEAWVRLTTALRAPLDPGSYLRLSSHQNLRDVRFPWPADENDQTRPKSLAPPREVQSPRPGLKNTPAPTPKTTRITRTDLQLLQKARQTSPNETMEIIELVTDTHIGTPVAKEEETTPKQVALKEDYSHPMTASQQEHLNQPASTLSQTPTSSQSDDPNSSRETAQTDEDQTSRITLDQPLTNESWSNDQQSEVSDSANAEPQEPQVHRVGERGSDKKD